MNTNESAEDECIDFREYYVKVGLDARVPEGYFWLEGDAC